MENIEFLFLVSCRRTKCISDTEPVRPGPDYIIQCHSCRASSFVYTLVSPLPLKGRNKNHSTCSEFRKVNVIHKLGKKCNFDMLLFAGSKA